MSRIILIVDPNASDADHLARLVAQALPGAGTIGASRGLEAFHLLAEQRVVPSMVIAEYQLPDMNGIEFLGHLRQERWLEGVPVAFLSNAASDREIVSCYRLGVQAFLGKPARLLEVRETLRAFARQAQVMNSASVIRPESKLPHSAAA